MHDLDRTQNMFESDYQEFEFESDGEDEFEGGGYQSNGEFEALDEVEEMESWAFFGSTVSTFLLDSESQHYQLTLHFV